jgi:stage V sporulation protein B
MFNLPASFVTPIALSLVPSIASAVKDGNGVRAVNTIDRSLKLCGLITIPASLGLSVFARPILELIFYGETDSINTAAPLLSILGISVFFTCIMTVTNSILQAYGEERKPIASMLIGATVKIILSYILIGIPALNVYGAPISTLACAFTVSLLNMSFVKKCAPNISAPNKLFFKVLVTSVISVGVGGVLYSVLSAMIGKSALLTAGTVFASGMFFLLTSFNFGAIDQSDILSVPCGEKIYKMLIKTRLIK